MAHWQDTFNSAMTSVVAWLAGTPAPVTTDTASARESTLDDLPGCTLASGATGAITKSDATTYSPPLRYLCATGAGDLVLMLSGDASNVITVPVVSGEKITCFQVKKVMAATTATGIMGAA